MPMSIDDKRYAKAYVRRVLLTVPFLVAMVFSLLPIGMYGVSWIRGKWVWHKEEAVVSLVTEEGSVSYNYSKKDVPYSGSYTQPKLLFYFAYGGTPEVGDTVEIAYDNDEPTKNIVFAKQESNIITWAIIFVVCCVLYFSIDTHLKKTSKVRLTG